MSEGVGLVNTALLEEEHDQELTAAGDDISSDVRARATTALGGGSPPGLPECLRCSPAGRVRPTVRSAISFPAAGGGWVARSGAPSPSLEPTDLPAVDGRALEPAERAPEERAPGRRKPAREAADHGGSTKERLLNVDAL